MPGRIIYLEVDDEITSAAARIRGSASSRLAVVLPHGSRVATSRINFRLLSRDAMTHEKRLSIVAADPATRALAASAGLPVFSSVAEYESTLAGIDEEPSTEGPASAVAAAAIAAGAAEPPRTDTPPSTPPADGTLGLVVPLAAVGAAGQASSADVLSGETVRTTVPRREPTSDPHPMGGTGPGPGGPPGPVAPAWAGSSGGRRTPWLIGAGILALAILVASVGAYLLLPSAKIVVTPRPERVGPIHLTVVADPTVTQPDAAAGVVPAKEISIPVAVNDTFSATGKRVELTNASGVARFENRDPTSVNRIPSGSIIRTASGIRFRTNVALTVPRAELVGLTIFPARASVRITAVEGGPEGNVDAGTIVIGPSGENSLFLKVTNPEPTTGGTRQEFTTVTQKDVNDALATLDTSLKVAFAAALVDPALAAGGATVFPSTGTLGPSTPTVPPETLVGQEVSTFALGLSATGTVISADTAPIEAIAASQVRTAVKPDYRLVVGSMKIEVGEAIIVGQSVSFPVTASAEQIAILDPDELTKLVLGKPVAEARSILEPYGEVVLSVSPDWANSIPTFESRVDLTIGHAVEIETPAPSGSARP
jgi:hypothetical protein